MNSASNSTDPKMTKRNNGSVCRPSWILKDELIMKDPTLLDALRRGSRLFEILDTLPTPVLEKFAVMAKCPVRPQAPNRRQSALQLLRRASRRFQDDGPLLDALNLWFSQYRLAALPPERANDESWQSALFLRPVSLLTTTDELPVDLREAADAMIRRESESISEKLKARWDETRALLLAMLMLESYEHARAAATRELVMQLSSAAQIDIDNLDAFECWRLTVDSVRGLEGELAGTIEDLGVLGRSFLESTVQLGFDVPDHLALEEGAKATEIVDHMVPEFLDGLREAILLRLAQFDEDSEAERARSLVSLAPEIVEIVTPRDAKTLEAEARALSEALEASNIDEANRLAPVLDAIGRLLLDDDASDEVVDVLQEEVSLKSYKAICARCDNTDAAEDGLEGRTDGRETANGLGNPAPQPVADDPSTETGKDPVHDDDSGHDRATPFEDRPTSSGVGIQQVEIETTPTAEPRGEDEDPGRGPDQPMGVAPPTAVPGSDAPAEETQRETSCGETETSRARDGADKRSAAQPVSDGRSGRAQIPAFASDDQITCLGELLLKRELDWAYWLAFGLGDASPAPDWLVEALRLGAQLKPGFGRSEERLLELLGQAASVVDDLDQAQTMLLAASALRPALLASHRNPIFILRRVQEKLSGLPALDELLKVVADMSEKGITVADELLVGLTTRADWENNRDSLSKEIDTWLESATQRTTKFQKATLVWQKWTNQGGELRNLLEGIRRGAVRDSDARSRIKEFRDDASFEKILKRTCHALKSNQRLIDVESRARDQLKRNSLQATGLAERWLELSAAEPRSDGGRDAYGRKALEKLRSIAQSALTEMSELTSESQPPIIRAASVRLAELVEDVTNLFQTSRDRQVLTDPFDSLRVPLLLLPEVGDVDGTGRGSPEFLAAVIRHVEAPLSPPEACLLQLEAGRIEQALRLAALVDLDDPNAAKALLAKADESRRDWSKRVQADLRKLSDEVEQRYLQGVLTESERIKLQRSLDDLDRTIEDETDRPDRILSTIEGHRESLSTLASKRRDILVERFDRVLHQFGEAGLVFPDRVREAFGTVLAQDDLSVAEEVLVRAREALSAGEVSEERLLPNIERRNSFDELIQALDDLYREAPDARSIRHAVRTRNLSTIEPLRDLEEQQLMELNGILDRWADLSIPSRHSRAEIGASVFRILRWLGFQVSADIRYDEISRQGPPHNWRHLRIKASLESPIPRFGSRAKERHDVVLTWGAFDPTTLAKWLTTNVDREKPVTVFYFGRLDGTARRRLIHAVRRERYCPVVIDVCLLTWLGRFSAVERTEALFEATLAGGWDNPYTPEVAGSVPAEMFFGREEDIEKLWKTDGPCIIYGGRQLGKSALLQQVRRFHQPSQDQFVFYEGVKYVTNIWDVIRNTLVDAELLLKKNLPKRSQRIKDSVRKMLEEHPSRRVVFLFDECDQLLDADRDENFPQMAAIRDLMIETDRRFKVVLTGLHNVQRFQRVANQPLAHFGDPLCIGPLAPRAAAMLVERPLKALGYRFDPPSLVQRVLAHTNYHPSLIQLFCFDLVDYMLRSARVNQDRTPPFMITEAAIAQVYRRVELLRKMRERFDWTLDLDPRYRAIGYTFAYLQLAGDLENDSIDGLRPRDVLSHVRAVWAEGFRATNEDELGGLLEEMCGLGLLISSATHRYRLRSPNVLRLLGSADLIESELERFSEKRYEGERDLELVRRLVPVSDRERGMTSPLTVGQEGRLIVRRRGVDLIMGSASLGLHRVEQAIGALLAERTNYENASLTTFRDVGSRAQGLTSIQEYYRDEKTSDVVRIVIRDGRLAAGELEGMIRDTLQWMDERLSSTQRLIRVVFLLPPATVWHLRESGALASFEEHEAVGVYRLRRWKEAGLRHWFDDIGRPMPANQEVSWMEATGGWSSLLEPLMQEFFETGKAPENGTIFYEAVEDLLESCGLESVPQVKTVFQALVDFGEIETEELSEFFETEGLKPREVRSVVDFMIDLDMVVGDVKRVRPEPVLLGAVRRVVANRTGS